MKEFFFFLWCMKEFWVFGLLGREDLDQCVKEEQFDGDVRRVYELFCQVEKGNLESLVGKYGGMWEVGNGEEVIMIGGGVNGVMNGNGV